MTPYVALFRAINVGGHRKLAMTDLREMAERLGLDSPRTVLQTGNLVFASAERRTDELEQQITRAVAEGFGMKSDVMVRDVDARNLLVAANPFQSEALADPAHLVVFVLKAEPAPDAKRAVEAAVKGRERVRLSDRSIYILYPDGIG